MAYTRNTWTNGAAPALNATNLNNIEAGVLNATTGGNLLSSGGSTAASDNAAALTAAAAANTEVAIPPGDYNFTTAPTIPAGTRLNFAKGARFVWNGTGVFITPTSRSKYFGGRVSLTAAGQTAFSLDNVFQCLWSDFKVDGLHAVGTGTTYQTQVGFKSRNNAGDSVINGFELSGLGEAVQSGSIMNYMIGGTVAGCWTGVHVDAGSFAGGMACHQVTFSSTTIVTTIAQARCGFLIDVNANQSWLSNCWFEGWATGVQIGSNSGTPAGPVGVSLRDVKIAATTKCLDIQSARQTRLDSVRFTTDSGATPTELTIDATNAPDGFASNLIS